jgi:hypothetical protein
VPNAAFKVYQSLYTIYIECQFTDKTSLPVQLHNISHVVDNSLLLILANISWRFHLIMVEDYFLAVDWHPVCLLYIYVSYLSSSVYRAHARL